MLKKHYIVFLLCFLIACGYKFVGSGTLPRGVNKIFVSIFENRTAEVGIGSKITNYLTNQLALRNENSDKKKQMLYYLGLFIALPLEQLHIRVNTHQQKDGLLLSLT